jgi:hypothetical protein
MWALNCFFFAVIFLAIRQGDLLSILPVSLVYVILLHWLEENINGTDNLTERPSSNDYNLSDRLADDTHSDLDNSKT